MTVQPEIKVTDSKAAIGFKKAGHFLSKVSWIFFVRNRLVGTLIFALTLLSPNMLFCSLSALAGALFFSYFTKLDESAFTPASLYNPYLTGMAVGAFYKFSPTVFLLCMASGILALFVNILLEKKLSGLNLPVLSLSFAIVSAGVSATLAYYSGLFSLEFYGLSIPKMSFLPLAVSAFFESVGSIIFMPNNICGLVLFSILAFISRVIAVHAIFGFFTGLMFKAALTGNLVEACNSFESFNWTLTGIAFGAFTSRAGAKSFVISAVGVAICVFAGSVMMAAASTFNALVYTLPFNLTVILILASMKSAGANYFPSYIRDTPELTMAEELNSVERFKYSEPSILLPFTGTCKVYQGFNGPWTHNGKWQHAVDFIRVDESGRMFKNAGEALDDYLTFGIPVHSPVTGWVMSCRHDLQDNAPGKVNNAENWGNYVILKTLDGLFVEISHLKQFSLLVNTGDYVTAGQLIGECGNSGFSAFPHIHIQVQKSAFLGEETIPFNFTVSMKDKLISYNSVPEEGQLITSPPFFLNSDNFLFGPLNSKWFLKDCESGENFEITVCRTQDIFAASYLEDKEGNKLFYSNLGGSFRATSYNGNFSSPLRSLFLSLPSLPFVMDNNYSWEEKIPLNVYYSSQKSQMKAFVASTVGGVNLPTGRWQINDSQVSGIIGTNKTSLKLNEEKDLEEFSVNGKKFVKRRYAL